VRVKLFGRRLGAVWAVAALVSGACMSRANAEDSVGILDVTQRPFEELLDTEIITAAKLARQISDAPSAVSIVTAQDIRDYGYRTLDDILSSMRGLYMAHDFRYAYLGGRGYGDPGDYAGRITLLIDGYAAPENYFGQTYFGEDGFLDVELIDRVEYIPGTGSSSYGGGAFLGVINVITKKGGDFAGAQVALDFGSHHLQKQRVTMGRRFENGGDLLLSISNYRSNGYDIPIDPDSDAKGLGQKESNQRLFIKGSVQGWTLTAAVVRRPVAIPGSPEDVSTDSSGFTSLKKDSDLSPRLKLSSHVYLGQYLYHSNFDGGGTESSDGRWWGVDNKLVSNAFKGHTVVVGAELRNDYRQLYQFSTPDSDPYVDDQQRKTVSLYAYDDIALAANWQLNLGLRHDHRNNGTGFTSPRIALIWTPTQGSVLKLSTGIAHLQPTPNVESFVPDAPIERLHNTELVWEQQLAPTTRLITSVYSYNIDQRTIVSPISTHGVEAELEHQWGNGTRLRTSYAWQRARKDDGTWPVDSPYHNAKFNFTVPLVGEKLRLGAEVQVLGRRLRYDHEEIPTSVMTNLALTSRDWWPNWQVSLSVRNAFNSSYTDVKNPGNGLQVYHRDGRNIWLQISRDFK